MYAFIYLSLFVASISFIYSFSVAVRIFFEDMRFRRKQKEFRSLMKAYDKANRMGVSLEEVAKEDPQIAYMFQ